MRICPAMPRSYAASRSARPPMRHHSGAGPSEPSKKYSPFRRKRRAARGCGSPIHLPELRNNSKESNVVSTEAARWGSVERNTAMQEQGDRAADDMTLSAFIDNELAAADAERVRARLATDASFAHRFSTMFRATAAIRGAYRDWVEVI